MHAYKIQCMVFKFEFCESPSRETEAEEARSGSLAILVHADMRAHALLPITTNICWEGCEKEGAVAERELKMQLSWAFFFGKGEEIRNRCFISHLISCSRCRYMPYGAVW